MDASVEVFNGSSWVTVYSVTPSVLVTDQTWTLVSYDVTPHKNANFQVRFGYTVLGTVSTYTCGGWNIDDVRLMPGQNCP